MIEKNLGPVNLVISYEGGYDIDNLRMAGLGILDIASRKFVFTKNPTKEKSAAKNPISYGGDVITCRLQQSGAYRFTGMLRGKLNREEMRELLLKDIEAMLDVLCKEEEGNEKLEMTN